MIEIKKGVFLSKIDTDNFRTKNISINFILPLSSDINGTAIIPYLLMRGSDRYPNKRAINMALDSAYSSKITPAIRKIGDNISISLNANSVDMPSDNVDILDILLEIIFNPLRVNESFKEEYFLSERSKLIDKIKMQMNDKRAYAGRRLIECMFSGTAFAINEYGENLEDITLSRINELYNYMIDNALIHIIAIGANINLDNLDKFKERNASNKKSSLAVLREQVLNIEEPTNVVQAKLAMGFVITSKNAAANLVFNALFGGSVNSKLFNNVREKLSLCYYASSNLIKSKGIISVNSGTNNDKVEIAKEAILAQLKDIKCGIITDDEFISSKKTVINNLKSVKSDIYSLENFYLSNENIDGLIASVQDICVQDVIDSAATVMLDTVYVMKGELNG